MSTALKISMASATFAALALSVFAGGITVAPFTYSALGLGQLYGLPQFTPNGGPAALAKWERVCDGDWQLHLEKNAELTEVAAAGAQINGVAGLSTTGLSIGFTVGTNCDGGDPAPTVTANDYCGAGAPRFNVRLTNGALVFLGCTYGNDGAGQVTFTAGNTYGGILFPEGETIDSISIVHDEPGSVNIDDIFVGADMVGGPNENRK